MRILFVHSGADLYGASRSLLRLSSRLARDGHAVLAVLPYEGPLRAELEQNGVRALVHRRMPVVTRPRVRSLIGLLSLALDVPLSTLWLWRVARQFRPGVIHTNTALILSPGLAARLSGAHHVWHVREFFAEFGKMWQWYQWYMARFADAIVCVSAPVAEQYDPRILSQKVIVIHNGFPKDEFAPAEEERVRAFRERLGLGNHRLVGVVGRIKFGRKGQDVFVRAVAQLGEKFPDVRYLFIGSPFPGNEAHLENLLALIRELNIEDRVVYAGDVEDIRAAYTALDVSVLPSALPEPFGGVVIESMAMGRPVVGTRHGGTIEQIEDGVTGLLVPPDNVAALAAALNCLLSDDELRIRMGEAAKDRFLRLFEFEPFYRKILAVYGKLIAP